MADDMDERYATFREHAESRERIASLEVTVQQITPALARIETAVIARNAGQQQPQETAAALALHRALDALPKQQGSGLNLVLIVLAIIGALAIGFVLADLIPG